jgi:uracil phosphoribosyltransferase
MKALYTIALVIFATVAAKANEGGLEVKKADLNSTVSVNMIARNNSINLKWTAVEQKNIVAFVIEKSRDGVAYNFVQNVNVVNAETLGQYASMKMKVNNPTYFRVGVKYADGTVIYMAPMLADGTENVEL